jgi:hypothetical protein
MKNKQLEKLFDMVCYMSDGAQGDYEIKTKKGIQAFKPKDVQKFVAKNLHEMITASYSPVDSSKAIQAFTGSTDLAEITTNVWNAFQETPNFDMYWQEAFRAVPLRKGQLSWTIGTVTSGVILQILSEGQKVQYNKIEGTKVTGSVDLYGSGLEMSWHTIEGRDLAGFYNAMMDFRNKRMKEYADMHYALLAAASLSNTVAYDTGGTTTLDKDINTINTAYNTIGNLTKDSGYGDTANVRMVMYVSPLLRNRINAAFRATASDVVRGKDGAVIDSMIDVRYTYNSAIPANKGILVLPKNKIQNAIYMQEKSFERQNPDNLSWLKSSFTAFGAVVGDTDQTAEISFT